MDALIITFRCVPRFEPLLPRPIPAAHGFPDWLKSMRSAAVSEGRGVEVQTVKQCPPFIDAMGAGFIIPLATDLHISGGKLSWQTGALHGKEPIDFHENVQVSGTPIYDPDREVIKFINFWTIQTPPGWSLLVTHPINRFDLPFTTLTGLVDSDRYYENFINFPAYWHDLGFDGVLAKGTPIAQCIPIKRENWGGSCERIEGSAADRLVELSGAMADGNSGIYRKQFRVPKRA
jgi:hypothetical protein